MSQKINLEMFKETFNLMKKAIKVSTWTTENEKTHELVFIDLWSQWYYEICWDKTPDHPTESMRLTNTLELNLMT